jgi:hypothetical protein
MPKKPHIEAKGHDHDYKCFGFKRSGHVLKSKDYYGLG